MYNIIAGLSYKNNRGVSCETYNHSYILEVKLTNIHYRDIKNTLTINIALPTKATIVKNIITC